MKRKRLTEIMPFLTPIRVHQKEFFYWINLKIHSMHYAKLKRESILKEEITKKKVALLNFESGYNMEYQYNKKENVKLASKKIHKVIIKPNETFSFWYLVKKPGEKQGYKKGLCISNGKMSYNYGGGLCLLSNFLYQLFLETPLKIKERHPHAYESFKPHNGEILGLDATIMYGWLDLKVENKTNYSFQILLECDEEYLKGEIRCSKEFPYKYEIKEQNGYYEKKDNAKYYQNEIIRIKKEKATNKIVKEELLYKNKIEVKF